MPFDDWSPDCTSCVCGFPHSLRSHLQAIERTQEERHAHLWDITLYRDDASTSDERDWDEYVPTAYNQPWQ
jgi:hypothetical protein